MESSQHWFAVNNGPAGEHYKVGRVKQKIRRYAYTPSSSLKPLVRLDLEIYQNVKEMLKKTEGTGRSSENNTDQESNQLILW